MLVTYQNGRVLVKARSIRGRPGLMLAPSKTDPRQRRWQRTGEEQVKVKTTVGRKKKIEENIQKFVDEYARKHGVKTILIRFTDKWTQKGTAYYETVRVRGGKYNLPKAITIYEWKAMKPYPDE